MVDRERVNVRQNNHTRHCDFICHGTAREFRMKMHYVIYVRNANVFVIKKKIIYFRECRPLCDSNSQLIKNQ